MRFSKYIIVKNGDWELPVVFSPLIPHSSVVVNSDKSCIVSAGLCAFTCQEAGRGIWTCWGKSGSLGLQSRMGRDAAILNRELDQEDHADSP